MPISLDDLNKMLATVLTLISLGGKWAVYGKELYDYIKSQTGMTDQELRERRDSTLDANETRLLQNLADAGAEP
jgi:hypothetical protein